MVFRYGILFPALFAFCLINFAYGATLLPDDEVQALKDIAKTMGKTDWNFDVDPCKGEQGWATVNATKGMENSVTCDCSFSNGTLCHVISITAECNQFSGNLPPELGNLTLIEKMHLTSNYLSGEIPQTFAKLTTLKDFRISDNNFTGNIPNFIQNWTKLERLEVQASGLVGPIPNGIADLENLTDLRISDLNGEEAAFPNLIKMKKMKTLILRSCNITGQLPGYLNDVTTLKMLDLSFNKLSGELPSTSTNLRKVDYIYLTGNYLTGRVPTWVLDDAEHMDLSYNNFPTGNSCQERNSVNLFASSSKSNNSGIVSCLRSFQCPKTFYDLHINCGGRAVTVNNTTYEDDTDGAGPSRFFQSRTNWAFSSTGNFLDDNRPIDTYIWTNTSTLSMSDSQLYMQARLSAISLTYYGFCLGNGIYTVNLHFAEIMFTDDKTYSSLGRRLFDIYIQRKLVIKDFNIEDEAGDIDKAIVKRFLVTVTDKTLEIRLYWAGKGTNCIPKRGVYGPLISAISVIPDFVPPSESSRSSNSISVGTVVRIVAAVATVVLLVVGILWWKGCLGKKNTMEQGILREPDSFVYGRVRDTKYRNS